MSQSPRANKTIGQYIQDRLQKVFDTSHEGPCRVLWWDASGHLKPHIWRASQALSVSFKKESHPLALRSHVPEPARAVWYVPDRKKGRDWFRDIAATGDEIKDTLLDVVVDMYGLDARWQLLTWKPDQSALDDNAAKILVEALSTPNRFPDLQQLQQKLLLEGVSSPVAYLLLNGWTIDDNESIVRRIRSWLEDIVPGIASAATPEAITDAVRRWCVAGYLDNAGVPRDLFPDDIVGHLDEGYRKLSVVSQNHGIPSDLFATPYWDSVVEQAWNEMSNPWKLVECPVDQSLEQQLWKAWRQRFEEGDFDACNRYADRRVEALRSAYNLSHDTPLRANDPADLLIWHQASALSTLGEHYKDYEKNTSGSWHTRYADKASGSWRIDRDVRRIILSGSPEEDLPVDHPACDDLPKWRQKYTVDRYLQYLRKLSKLTKRTFRNGQVERAVKAEDLSLACRFWDAHDRELAESTDTALFYIDALRLDLAYELSDQLKERGLTTEPTVHLGTLPSETEFGMAALLPGPWKEFRVRTNEKNTLSAYRDGQHVRTEKRKDLLSAEGWHIADGKKNWSHSRVVYADTEIDDYGENEISKIEKKLDEYVEDLAGLIYDKLTTGGLQQAYVFTDHGFVLLPENVRTESIDAPEASVHTKSRRVALHDENAEVDLPGVQMSLRKSPEATPYLDDPVHLLVDAEHRFARQGLSTGKRFFHGGALPQECILCFLHVTKES